MDYLFTYFKSIEPAEAHRLFTLTCYEILQKEKPYIEWHTTLETKKCYREDGIDIIGIDKNNFHTYVFCKFIEEDTLNFDTVYSIYTAIEEIIARYDTPGIIMSNAKYIDKNLNKLYMPNSKYYSNKISNIDLFLESYFSGLNPEFFIAAYKIAINKNWDAGINIDTRIEINPRPYQVKAIDTGSKWFYYNYTGILKIIDGVGKIYIAAWIIKKRNFWSSCFVTSTPAKALKIQSALRKLGMHRGKRRKGILCILSEDEVGDSITDSFVTPSIRKNYNYLSIWENENSYQGFDGYIYIMTYNTFKQYYYLMDMTILVDAELLDDKSKIKDEPIYSDFGKYIYITHSPELAGIELNNYRGENRIFFNYSLASAIRDGYARKYILHFIAKSNKPYKKEFDSIIDRAFKCVVYHNTESYAESFVKTINPIQAYYLSEDETEWNKKIDMFKSDRQTVLSVSMSANLPLISEIDTFIFAGNEIKTKFIIPIITKYLVPTEFNNRPITIFVNTTIDDKFKDGIRDNIQSCIERVNI